MVKLIESIRILNGRISHLNFHENRCNESRAKLWNLTNAINLRKKMIIPRNYQDGLVKCRLVYSQEIEEISFQAYQIRTINKIKIIQNDTISYPFKFEERKELDTLFAAKDDSDEIMIVKNNLVTDAYYYNYVFQKGKQYFTPNQPLLEGVMRSSLILNNKIIKKDIFVTEIQEFDAIHLINAMTPLGKIVVKPNQLNT
ncbi:MAG TPA: aminotransferase class IV [Saprospiraceae bacterium]|nr:aminotransferase class IV [Saprospiraceae bacterium]